MLGTALSVPPKHMFLAAAWGGASHGESRRAEMDWEGRAPSAHTDAGAAVQPVSSKLDSILSICSHELRTLAPGGAKQAVQPWEPWGSEEPARHLIQEAPSKLHNPGSPWAQRNLPDTCWIPAPQSLRPSSIFTHWSPCYCSLRNQHIL